MTTKYQCDACKMIASKDNIMCVDEYRDIHFCVTCESRIRRSKMRAENEEIEKIRAETQKQ